MDLPEMTSRNRTEFYHPRVYPMVRFFRRVRRFARTRTENIVFRYLDWKERRRARKCRKMIQKSLRAFHERKLREQAEVDRKAQMNTAVPLSVPPPKPLRTFQSHANLHTMYLTNDDNHLNSPRPCSSSYGRNVTPVIRSGSCEVPVTVEPGRADDNTSRVSSEDDQWLSVDESDLEETPERNVGHQASLQEVTSRGTLSRFYTSALSFIQDVSVPSIFGRRKTRVQRLVDGRPVQEPRIFTPKAQREKTGGKMKHVKVGMQAGMVFRKGPFLRHKNKLPESATDSEDSSFDEDDGFNEVDLRDLFEGNDYSDNESPRTQVC